MNLRRNPLPHRLRAAYRRYVSRRTPDGHPVLSPAAWLFQRSLRRAPKPPEPPAKP